MIRVSHKLGALLQGGVGALAVGAIAALGARAQPAPQAQAPVAPPASNATAPAASGQSQGTTWTLPALVEELRRNNPQLRSSQGLALAAQYGVDPVAAPDNPTFSVTQSPIPGSPFAIGASQGMTWALSQNVYWPGKKRLAGEIAQAQADQAKLQVESLRVQITGQLKSAWISWQQNEAQRLLLLAQMERLDQIKRVTQTRYANNAAAYADFINAQVSQASVRTQIIGIEAQQRSLLAQVNALIGRAPGAPLALQVDEFTLPQDMPDLDSFHRMALDRNPQLKVSQRAIEGAQRGVDLAELGSRPDFNVSFLFNSGSAPWGFDNTQSYGVALGVTFPLWYEQREKNLLDQAKAQLAAVQDADQSNQQQTLAAVDSAYYQWLQSIEQVKLVQDRIVEQARIAYRLLLTNYSTGQAGYVDLMNAYTAMNNAEALNVQTRASAVQARIALDVATGVL